MLNIARQVGVILTAEDRGSGNIAAFRNSIASLNDPLSGVQRLLGGLGAGLSAAAFTGWVAGAISAADALRDLSKSTDLSVTQLAGLKLAAEQSGSTLDDTAKAINKLSQNIGKDADKFARLGITAKEPLEAFKQYADLYRAIEDPQKRAALSADVLGKSWAGAAPLLDEGSARIQQMIDRGIELSGITDQLAEDADEFGDKWAELKTALGGTANVLAGNLLPLITTLAEDLVASAEGADKLDTAFDPLTETLRALIVLGGNVAFVFKGIGTEIGGVAAQLAAIGRGDFAAAGAIGDAMKADAAKARTDFDAWEAKIMAAGQGPRAARTGEARPKLTAGQAAAVDETLAGDEAKGRAAAAKKLAAQYASLIAEIREKTAAELAEAAAGEKLTSLQSHALKLMTDLREGKLKLTDLQKGGLAVALEEMLAAEKANELRRTELAQKKEWSEAAGAAAKAQAESLAGLEREVVEREAALATYGMTESAIAALTVARLEDRLALYAGIDGYEAEVEALKKTIALRRRLVDATAGIEKADAVKKATDAAAAEWDKFADQIEQGLTDALYRGFEAGNGFGENFVETLRNTLKTAALKIAVQAVVDPVMGGVRSMMGAPGSAGGSLSTISSAWSMFSGGSAASLGGMIGGEFGAGMAGAYLAPGLAGPTTAGAAGAMGMGATLGAALPYVGAALAAYSLLSDSGLKEDPHNNADQSGVSISFGTSGAIGNSNSANGNWTGTPSSWVAGQTSGNGRWADWSAMDSGTVAQIAAQRDAIVQLSRDAALSLKLDAGLIRNAAASGNFATIDDALASFGDNVSLRLLPALGQFREGGERLVATLSRVVGSVKTFDKWGEGLDLTISEQGKTKTAKTRNAIYDKATLVKMLGGSQGFDTAMAGYAEAAYSEEERRAIELAQAHAALADTFGRLKMAVPETRDELREVVQSLELAKLSGQKAFASIVGVADAFKVVWSAADAATQAAIEQAKATSDAAASLYDAMRGISAQMEALDGLRSSLRLDSPSATERIGELFGKLDGADFDKQLDLAGQIRDLVLSRYEEEKSAIEQNRDAWRQARAQLMDFTAGLRLSELSPLTAGQRLAESGAQFSNLYIAAQGGSRDAMSGLSGAAQTYLQEARGYYASSATYSQIFGQVESSLNVLGLASEATDTWQADLLNVQDKAQADLGRLVTVTESMGADLTAALDAQAREFAKLQVPLDKVVANTSQLDARIAAAVAAVLQRVTIKTTDSGAVQLANNVLYVTRNGQQVPA